MAVNIEGSLEHIVKVGSEWITSAGEILAVARFSRAAGGRDYLLFDDPSTFAEWAFSLPADTNLLVLKDYELTLRGEANAVLPELPDESDVEWLLLVDGGGFDSRNAAWECWGTSEVREHLAKYETEHVAAGRMPMWNPAVADHAPDTLSAIVPRNDGTVHRGIY